MEYAILSAIAAMNEPKTCSTTALKKYVLENHPGTNSNYQSKNQSCVHFTRIEVVLFWKNCRDHVTNAKALATDWKSTRASFKTLEFIEIIKTYP